MMEELKGVSPAAFLDDMFESDADKKALAEHIRRRKVVSTLAALRVAKGLTQDDIAAVIGCKQARISKLEAGVDADLKLSDIEAYAKATESDVTLMVSDRGKSLAEKLPVNAENGQPYIQIASVDQPDEKCPEAPQAQRRPKRPKVSPIS